MASIVLNARFSLQQTTGVQRYASEIAARIGNRVARLRPPRALHGMAGHAWEQIYLPVAAHGKLLWNPNCTGPVTVQQQVCTFHDLIVLDHPEWFSPRFAQWYKWLLPRVARQCRALIAVSEYTKHRVVEMLEINPARITVVPNGVGENFRPAAPREATEVREWLGIGERPFLLSVGTLEPRKNLRRLLTAWSIAQDQVPEEMELVIAGAAGAPSIFAGQDALQAPSRTRLVGYCQEPLLPALYSEATAFVYPSLYEGFGLPPLEAMACGTPVICSETSSLPEVVGDAALLVDPQDPRSIADAIVQLANSQDQRGELRHSGRQRAARFSWDAAAQQTWTLLCEHAA